MKSERVLSLMLACVLSLSAGCTQMRGYVQKVSPSFKSEQENKLNFAKVYESDGNLVKAEKLYRELEQASPKEAIYKHRLGIVLVRRGQFEEGFALLEKAKLMDPENVALLNDIGYAYLLQGQFDTAETLLREALAIEPKNPRTLNNLGLAVGYAGRTNDAYSIFRQAMSESEAYANIGFVHSQRGDIEQAMEWYNKALTKDPSSKAAAQALVQLSDVQKKIESKNEAIARKNRASSIQTAGTPKNVIRQVHNIESDDVIESVIER